MRITLVANEFPFPPSHGGRVDVWRRLCAMREAGIRTQLVCWSNEASGATPAASAMARVTRVVDAVHLYSFRRGPASRLMHLGRLARLPWSVAGRDISARQWRRLLAAQRAFGAQAVWLDALYGGEVARRLAHELNVPLFYRSHNVEHLYIQRQLKLAQSWPDRVRWMLRGAHLERYERGILEEAAAFFDISVDDLSFWRSQGFRHGHWLPPLIDSALARSLDAPAEKTPQFDIAYLGNLFMPNNVDGVVWFLREVMPVVLSRAPEVKLCVAGSRAVARVREAVAACPAATFIDNPPDAGEVLRSARVLVNPVFAGSGVNIKAVEMLFAPAMLVSTSQGVSGLPADVRTCFYVADDAPSFAQSILSALGAGDAACGHHVDARRQQARHHFRAERVKELLPVLKGRDAVTNPVRRLA